MVLIEDNPADVVLVKHALALHGIAAEMTEIDDGEAAVRFVQKIDGGTATAPDVFILDLSLPKRTGHEVLEEIRRCQSCAGSKVLIVSSSSASTDKMGTKERGADRYFVKPSNYDDFMKIGAVLLELLG
jgi:DNA-binding response OmpR family regulator